MAGQAAARTHLLDLPNEILSRIAHFVWEGVHFWLRENLLDKESTLSKTLAGYLSSRLICKKLSPIMTRHLFPIIDVDLSPEMLPVLDRLQPLLDAALILELDVSVFFEERGLGRHHGITSWQSEQELKEKMTSTLRHLLWSNAHDLRDIALRFLDDDCRADIAGLAIPPLPALQRLSLVQVLPQTIQDLIRAAPRLRSLDFGSMDGVSKLLQPAQAVAVSPPRSTTLIPNVSTSYNWEGEDLIFFDLLDYLDVYPKSIILFTDLDAYEFRLDVVRALESAPCLTSGTTKWLHFITDTDGEDPDMYEDYEDHKEIEVLFEKLHHKYGIQFSIRYT